MEITKTKQNKTKQEANGPKYSQQLAFYHFSMQTTFSY